MSEKKINLPSVTYVGILANVKSNGELENLLKIGHETSKGINFHKKVIYSCLEPTCETYDFEIVKIETQEYNCYTKWFLDNLRHFFDSDFMINFHADGMIQNPEAWTDEFLDYDYIGAPWNSGSEGGNGGFALRSKLLCAAASKIDTSPNTPQTGLWDNEDVLICKTHAEFMKSEGVKFAPAELAARFSTEHFSFNSQGYSESFGFHEIEKLFMPDVKEHRQKYLKEILGS